jgi:hypothetical protein
LDVSVSMLMNFALIRLVSNEENVSAFPKSHPSICVVFNW